MNALTGPPPKPSAAGSVGRGGVYRRKAAVLALSRQRRPTGAKERNAVFAWDGQSPSARLQRSRASNARRKRSKADFAPTRFAETYRPADGYRREEVP